MPTLLDYLGLPNPAAGTLPGRSFAPLLRGEALPASPDESVVVFDEYGPTRMIRSREWKYIHRYPYGPHELYDLKNDPGEEHNLMGDASKMSIIQQYKARLDAWFARYADPRIDGTREAVTGKGQLQRAGALAEGYPVYADDWSYIDEKGNRLPR
jgi:arylsulfatase A-like enzyme